MEWKLKKDNKQNDEQRGERWWGKWVGAGWR
jgi:hypothetical protein